MLGKRSFIVFWALLLFTAACGGNGTPTPRPATETPLPTVEESAADESDADEVEAPEEEELTPTTVPPTAEPEQDLADEATEEEDAAEEDDATDEATEEEDAAEEEDDAADEAESGSGGTSSSIAAAVALSNPERGKELFETFQADAGFACSTCHRANSMERLIGPGLLGIPERAATRISGMAAEDYIFESITNPDAFLVEDFPDDLMPENWAEIYSNPEILDIVAYLMTLNEE